MPTATETIKSSESLRLKLRRTVEDTDYHILLLACLENMGPYKKGLTFSDHEHIQQMWNGGKEAVDLFIYNLRTLPYKEPSQEQEDFQFVPPSELANML